MKLLGVEFFDFACFEQQFIPLPSGISLLAGRNNSGKTAVLRGLSLLGSLPINPLRPVRFPVAPYCRAPKTTFDFHIIFICEASDFRSFADQDPRWTELMLKRSPYLRFIFRFHTNANTVSLVAVNLHVGDDSHANPIHLVECRDQGFLLTRYQTVIENGTARLGAAQGTSDVPIVGTLTTFGDGTKGGVIQANNMPLLAPLLDLADTRLVAAHRVPLAQMGLQSTFELPSDANTLASYLQTLQNNERQKFNKIESFVTGVFPEFEYVNPSNRNNQVAVTLTRRGTTEEVPLSYCGTGVEQLLTLATFAATSAAGCVLLLDEPHSFLHPSAERKLVEFINKSTTRHLLVSTHSAILINSIEADRITYLQPPGDGFFKRRQTDSTHTAKMLFDLGYKNSDVLFHDRLIAVEGETDRDILRLLLPKVGRIADAELDRTGFPVMEGAGEGVGALQTAVLRFEKLLTAIGRSQQQRIYLFDGDKTPDDKTTLQGTAASNGLRNIPIVFLKRLEIENYLLSPEAIAQALIEQGALDGFEVNVTAADIAADLNSILASSDSTIFPRGRKGEPINLCKGYKVLQIIFNKYGKQRYEKRRTGILIAKLISVKNQPGLTELVDVIRPLYSDSFPAVASAVGKQ